MPFGLDQLGRIDSLRDARSRSLPPLPDPAGWLPEPLGAGGWPAMPKAVSPPPVAILLSTFNGEAYLAEQLDSLRSQTHENWRLFWRDDGSSDRTCAILDAFARDLPEGRCVRLGPEGHLGITGSFLALLRQVPDEHFVAFADQDDVWLPYKLERGLLSLGDSQAARPALYCARQLLVDAALRTLGLSPSLKPMPPFPASLTQNIATGCTVMLNPAAVRLVASSRPPVGTLHDWWSYLMVGAAGGRLLADPAPVVLYRQHPRNAVGARSTLLRRGLMALRRGPDAFMTLFRIHVAELAATHEALSPAARLDVARLQSALDGSRLARLRAVLELPRLVRQTWLETLLFRLWFLIG